MKTGDVAAAMVRYYAGDARRVNHLLKVFGFAKMIGEREGLDAGTQEILEIAALVHDIDIRNSERKFGMSSGEHQQIEGPPITLLHPFDQLLVIFLGQHAHVPAAPQPARIPPPRLLPE